MKAKLTGLWIDKPHTTDPAPDGFPVRTVRNARKTTLFLVGDQVPGQMDIVQELIDCWNNEQIRLKKRGPRSWLC